jgi:hypothetical protein
MREMAYAIVTDWWVRGACVGVVAVATTTGVVPKDGVQAVHCPDSELTVLTTNASKKAQYSTLLDVVTL